MKKRLSIGFIIIAACVALYFVFAPTRLAEQAGETDPAASAPPATAPGPTRTAPAQDDRREAMAAAYRELESDREALTRRIASLKARLWGMQMPVEEAQEIQSDLMHAHLILRNPPLLGAFSDLQGIVREQDKVRAALARLDDTQRLLDQKEPPEGS